jgi:hypothetical protein
MQVGDLVTYNIKGLEMYLGILIRHPADRAAWEVLWNGYGTASIEYECHLELAK